MRTKPICIIACLVYSCAVYAQSDEVARLRHSFSQLRDSTSYVDALNRLAMLLYEKSIDSTFSYTVKARQTAIRIGYLKGQADAVNNMGVVFDVRGNLQLALEYYTEANLMYKQLDDRENYVQTLMNIAMVYNQMGRHARAVSQFEEAKRIGLTLERDSIMSLVIYNYILQYPGRFDRTEKAKEIKKARAIAGRYNDERTLIAIDQLTAEELINQGQREKGVALLDSTLRAAIQNKLYYASMDLSISMGDQLLATDTAQAASYYRSGLSASKKKGYLIYSQIFARKLFDLHYSRQDYARAALYARELIALRDARESLSRKSSVDYLDYVIKDEQVKALSTRSRYQTIFLVLLVLICLLALGFLLFLRSSLGKTKKLNRQISDNNKQLRQTLTALEQSQKENTRVLQIVAHDLRNPIGAITSIATMMLREGERSEDDRTMLEMILTSSNNSLNLVNDLLQIHANQEEIQKEPAELDRMLHYCVELLENQAAAKAQRIELHTEALVVPANREKLWRVLSNLISNAIKFSSAGDKIEVKLHREDHHALVSVRDQGIGIPEELGDKVFDMFTEARRYGTAGEESFGLGLAISRQIIEAHSGKIWFESTADQGTTFFVSLPIYDRGPAK